MLNLTEYDYDSNGNRTLERINRPNGAQVTTYAYTDADQLAQSERRDLAGITLSAWTYDDAGNRASETVTRTAATANATPAQTTRSYTYDARNQLTQVSQSGADGTLSTTYGYDLQGNQLNKTRAGLSTTYGYDAHDQLISVARDGTVLGNYRNNHLGLRIEKEAKDPLNAQGPPLKLHTLWDGHDAILDQNESGQVIARYDFAGRAPIGLWHKQDGLQSLHADALGSIVLATDDKGASKAETLFDAWGNPIVDEGQSGNKFGYTGHQMDEESGLIYAQARYYDPETGRFLTQDPAEGNPEAPLSFNSYLYAFGNPTVYTDPDGQIALLKDGADTLGDFNKWLRSRTEGCTGGIVCAAAGATIGVSRAVVGLGELGLRGVNVVANTTSLALGTVGLNSQENIDAHAAELEGTINTVKAASSAVVHAVGTSEGRQDVADKAFGTIEKALKGDAGAVSDLAEFGAGFVGGGSAVKNAAKVSARVEAGAARVIAEATVSAEAAGVRTTASGTLKAAETVTAEAARSPGVAESLSRATGSVEAKPSARSFSLWSGSGDRIGSSLRSQRGAVGDLSAATNSAGAVDRSWKLKIDGTAQRTGDDAAHQIRTYREAITLAKDPDVVSVHLDHGYNRALGLDPKTISPNRRPDVTAIYSDKRVLPVEVQSATDNPAILRARNAALAAQIRAQGYTPLPPKVVVPTRPPKP